jgi:hypothetical protein
MNTRFKVFASVNVLQYLCDFIHVLIFVTVSKCRKFPKLTNIVIEDELTINLWEASLYYTLFDSVKLMEPRFKSAWHLANA